MQTPSVTMCSWWRYLCCIAASNGDCSPLSLPELPCTAPPSQRTSDPPPLTTESAVAQLVLSLVGVLTKRQAETGDYQAHSHVYAITQLSNTLLQSSTHPPSLNHSPSLPHPLTPPSLHHSLTLPHSTTHSPSLTHGSPLLSRHPSCRRAWTASAWPPESSPRSPSPGRTIPWSEMQCGRKCRSLSTRINVVLVHT